MSQIVDFLTERGWDSRHRLLGSILVFTDSMLEHNHDYIQWLFPLAEQSVAVPDSPVLTEDDVRSIRSYMTAQRNLRLASYRMLMFYSRFREWTGEQDHNHLRITRIIKSLRLLAGDKVANTFRENIYDLLGIGEDLVPDRVKAYWDAA